MAEMSVSFALGKASSGGSINLDHNNRKFIAKNIDKTRTAQNITYKSETIEVAYNKLFGEALREYNDKQKQPCRRISDYYEHIKNGKREETCYEFIVQFGDKDTAGCMTENGAKAKQMLDEYMKEFEKRNPNLYVFNAVMHLDEATPHLHIDVIPFYEKSKTNGLSKGVSMRAALDEQGYTATNRKQNRLVAFEENERTELEKILTRNGFTKAKSQVTKAVHLPVDEYKEVKEKAKLTAKIVNAKEGLTVKNLTPSQASKMISDNAKLRVAEESLRREINETRKEVENAKSAKLKNFYYSNEDKCAFVKSKLEEIGVSFSETENGFSAPEWAVEDIRKIEKTFKSNPTNDRGKLKSDIDEIVMKAKDWDDFIYRLRSEKHYAVKLGKYVAVRPFEKHAEATNGRGFIRLKSLGAEYSEEALRKRIADKNTFIARTDEKMKAVHNPKIVKQSFEYMTFKTIHEYAFAISKGSLLSSPYDKNAPLSFNNDRRIRELIEINKTASEYGISNIDERLESSINKIHEAEKKIKELKSDVEFFADLKSKADFYFDWIRKGSPKLDAKTEAKIRVAKEILDENNINAEDNIANVERALNQTKAQVFEAEKQMKEIENETEKLSKLKMLSDEINGGAYVSRLVREYRETKFNDMERTLNEFEIENEKVKK